MIKSMTGFGRHEVLSGARKLTVEMKAVNHRYLDLNIKLPKKLSSMEQNIRSILKESIYRGKLDVYVTYENTAETDSALHYNAALAGEYLKYLRQMSEAFGLEDDIKTSTLARFPEVFVMEEQEVDEEQLSQLLNEAVRGAAAQFTESRIAEGSHLQADLLEKLDEMEACVDFIEVRYPKILAEYRGRLETKVRELFEDKQLDENRLAMEVTLFADKICVDEETVRLRSHIHAVRSALEQGGSVGRKLDFIAQEMNREANTILSKANDLAISDTGIELKTCIEKIREQIQNLE